MTLLSLLAQGCTMWPRNNPDDPGRCEPACTGGATCENGQCVSGKLDSGVDLTPAWDAPRPDSRVADLQVPDLPLPDQQVPDMPVPDLPVPDMPVPDMPVPDMPVPDLPVPDMPVPDFPVPDFPVPDMPVPDQKIPDMPPPDMPSKPPLLGLQHATGTGGIYRPYVTVDAKDNIILAGNFQGTMTLGTTTLTSTGGGDIFVAKFNANGTLAWVAQNGGSSGSQGVNAVTTDASENILITGYTQDTATFGSISLTNPQSGNHLLVARLTSSGTWDRAVNTGGSGHTNVQGLGVTADSSGNAVVTGALYNPVNFGSTTITSNGMEDIFIARYNMSTSKWDMAVGTGTSNNDRGKGVAIDGNGDYLVTGCFRGTASFGSTSLTSATNLDWDIFLAKLTPGGTWSWALKAGGNKANSGHGVVVDSSDRAWITGYYMASVTFGTHAFSNAGSRAPFIARATSAGAWDMAEKIADSGYDSEHSIALDSSGNVIVAGPYSGTATIGSTTLTSAGGLDIFVARRTSSGTYDRAYNAGGSSTDVPTGVAVDSYGRIYVATYFQSPTATYGSTTLTNGGSIDTVLWPIEP